MEAVDGEPTEASKVGICGVITVFTGRTQTVTPGGKLWRWYWKEWPL